MKIVLTGGPCAGKTTIGGLLSSAFFDRAVIVPESASMLLKGGFPRWPEPYAVAAFQTSIYRLQVEVENLFSKHYPGKLLVLDRGTVDGAAYWPDGPDAFFKAMDTTEKAELARYDQVIYLESAGQKDYYRYKGKNPTRNEDWEQAQALDAATHAIWARHSNLITVPCQATFVDKVLHVVRILEKALK